MNIACIHLTTKRLWARYCLIPNCMHTPVNIQRLHVINSMIVRSFSNLFSSANISRHPRSTHYIWTPMLLCGSTRVRAYKKLPCLREVCGFVIVTETLQKEFDDFKSSLPRVEFSRLEISPLLQYSILEKLLEAIIWRTNHHAWQAVLGAAFLSSRQTLPMDSGHKGRAWEGLQEVFKGCWWGEQGRWH